MRFIVHHHGPSEREQHLLQQLCPGDGWNALDVRDHPVAGIYYGGAAGMLRCAPELLAVV